MEATYVISSVATDMLKVFERVKLIPKVNISNPV